MITTIGDLVEDVTVHLAGAVNLASDTEATIVRRRGGSAAGVAVAAVAAGGQARFIGQVGDDQLADTLLAAMTTAGVDLCVRRRGRTGTIVVLVDRAGERTMLTDRGCSRDLDGPESAWLDRATALHVPLYSLIGGPLATTAATVIGWAHDRGVAVSIDASSAGVIQETGVATVRRLLAELGPQVLLANELEAETLGSPLGLARDLVVIKNGPAPTQLVDSSGTTTTVDVTPIDHVTDTTGAGDAFAAGFLVALTNGADPVTATHAAHASARRLLIAQSEAGT